MTRVFDNWRQWNGKTYIGPIPDVRAGEYQIKERDGTVSVPKCAADRAGWLHMGEVTDIIAYRLLFDATPPAAGGGS